MAGCTVQAFKSLLLCQGVETTCYSQIINPWILLEFVYLSGSIPMHWETTNKPHTDSSRGVFILFQSSVSVCGLYWPGWIANTQPV